MTSMTIWHIQKLYTDDGILFEALPYDLFSTIKDTLKMKNGVTQTLRFMTNGRLSEKSAKILANQTKDKFRL